MGKTTEISIGIPSEIGNEIDMLLKTNEIKIFDITSRRQFVIAAIKKYTEYIKNPAEYIKKEKIKDIKKLQENLEAVITEQKNENKKHQKERKDQNKILDNITREHDELKENYNNLSKQYREASTNIITDELINKRIDMILKERKINEID